MSIISLFLVFTMLAVIWFDVTRYIIPNWLVGGLLAAYPIAVYLSPAAVEWQMALLAMAGALVVGYGIFFMKWMGAGDIKLLAVCVLWVGLSGLVDFVFIVAVLGGLLSLGLWGGRKLVPVVPMLASRQMPRILQNGAPVPYGIAIALGMLWMLEAGKIAVAMRAASL